MRNVHITGTELNTSALCLGTAMFGVTPSESDSCKQMDCFFEAGGNFLDTARIYSDWVPGEKGRSERIIGNYLADRKTREQWFISSKGGHPLLSAMDIPRLSREELISDIDGSLKALKTDYIDLYYLHRDNTKLPVEEIIGWMNEFVIAGRIRYFGCSNWKTQRIREAQRYAKASGKMGFAANQALWNIGCLNMKPSADRTLVVMDNEMRQFHHETKLAAIPYSSQAGGFFSMLNSDDNSTRQAALKSNYASPTNLTLFATIKELAQKYKVPVSHIVLAYLTLQPTTVIPVFSSDTIEQLNETILSTDIELTHDEIELLELASKPPQKTST